MTDDRAIVQAHDVGVRYTSSLAPALTRASLEILRGDTVGLVGESGSGKSTFAKILVGALAPTAGSVEVYGQPWSKIPRRDVRRRRVQMVFQDPYASLNPLMPVLDAVAEVYEVWDGHKRHRARLQAAETLDLVGLASEFHHEKPRHLSGGQCQRVGIARALAGKPDLLVADEPTSALDVSIQADILNLLVELRHERELAIVLVSHDLAVVRYLTETTLVLYRGEIVERGATTQMMEAPKHPYTRLLLNSARGTRPGRAGSTESANMSNSSAQVS